MDGIRRGPAIHLTQRPPPLRLIDARRSVAG